MAEELVTSESLVSGASKDSWGQLAGGGGDQNDIGASSPSSEKKKNSSESSANDQILGEGTSSPSSEKKRSSAASSANDSEKKKSSADFSANEESVGFSSPSSEKRKGSYPSTGQLWSSVSEKKKCSSASSEIDLSVAGGSSPSSEKKKSSSASPANVSSPSSEKKKSKATSSANDSEKKKSSAASSANDQSASSPSSEKRKGSAASSARINPDDGSVSVSVSPSGSPNFIPHDSGSADDRSAKDGSANDASAVDGGPSGGFGFFAASETTDPTSFQDAEYSLGPSPDDSVVKTPKLPPLAPAATDNLSNNSRDKKNAKKTKAQPTNLDASQAAPGEPFSDSPLAVALEAESPDSENVSPVSKGSAALSRAKTSTLDDKKRNRSSHESLQNAGKTTNLQGVREPPPLASERPPSEAASRASAKGAISAVSRAKTSNLDDQRSNKSSQGGLKNRAKTTSFNNSGDAERSDTGMSSGGPSPAAGIASSPPSVSQNASPGHSLGSGKGSSQASSRAKTSNLDDQKSNRSSQEALKQRAQAPNFNKIERSPTELQTELQAAPMSPSEAAPETGEMELAASPTVTKSVNISTNPSPEKKGSLVSLPPIGVSTSTPIATEEGDVLISQFLTRSSLHGQDPPKDLANVIEKTALVESADAKEQAMLQNLADTWAMVKEAAADELETEHKGLDTLKKRALQSIVMNRLAKDLLHDFHAFKDPDSAPEATDKATHPEISRSEAPRLLSLMKTADGPSGATRNTQMKKGDLKLRVKDWINVAKKREIESEDKVLLHADECTVDNTKDDLDEPRPLVDNTITIDGVAKSQREASPTTSLVRDWPQHLGGGLEFYNCDGSMYLQEDRHNSKDHYHGHHHHKQVSRDHHDRSHRSSDGTTPKSDAKLLERQDTVNSEIGAPTTGTGRRAHHNSLGETTYQLGKIKFHDDSDEEDMMSPFAKHLQKILEEEERWRKDRRRKREQKRRQHEKHVHERQMRQKRLEKSISPKSGISDKHKKRSKKHKGDSQKHHGCEEAKTKSPSAIAVGDDKNDKDVEFNGTKLTGGTTPILEPKPKSMESPSAHSGIAGKLFGFLGRKFGSPNPKSSGAGNQTPTSNASKLHSPSFSPPSKKGGKSKLEFSAKPMFEGKHVDPKTVKTWERMDELDKKLDLLLKIDRVTEKVDANNKMNEAVTKLAEVLTMQQQMELQRRHEMETQKAPIAVYPPSEQASQPAIELVSSMSEAQAAHGHITAQAPTAQLPHEDGGSPKKKKKKKKDKHREKKREEDPEEGPTSAEEKAKKRLVLHQSEEATSATGSDVDGAQKVNKIEVRSMGNDIYVTPAEGASKNVEIYGQGPVGVQYEVIRDEEKKMCELNLKPKSDEITMYDPDLGYTQTVHGKNIELDHSKRDQVLVGNDNTIRGKLSEIRGDGNEIFTDHNRVIGNNNIIHSDHNQIMGSGNNVFGQWNVLVGRTNKIFSDNNTITGEKNEVQSSFNQIEGNKNYIYGPKNTIQGNGNEIHSKDNKIFGKGNLIFGPGNETYEDNDSDIFAFNEAVAANQSDALSQDDGSGRNKMDVSSYTDAEEVARLEDIEEEGEEDEKVKAATIKIQSYFKGRKTREEYAVKFRTTKAAATKIQAWYRGTRDREKVKGLRRDREFIKVFAIKLQAQCRMMKARREFGRTKKTAVQLQSFFKGREVRDQYRKMRRIRTKLEAMVALGGADQLMATAKENAKKGLQIPSNDIEKIDLETISSQDHLQALITAGSAAHIPAAIMLPASLLLVRWKERLQAAEIREAAVVVQKHLRAKQARKSVAEQRKAVFEAQQKKLAEEKRLQEEEAERVSRQQAKERLQVAKDEEERIRIKEEERKRKEEEERKRNEEEERKEQERLEELKREEERKLKEQEDRKAAAKKKEEARAEEEQKMAKEKKEAKRKKEEERKASKERQETEKKASKERKKAEKKASKEREEKKRKSLEAKKTEKEEKVAVEEKEEEQDRLLETKGESQGVDESIAVEESALPSPNVVEESALPSSAAIEKAAFVSSVDHAEISKASFEPPKKSLRPPSEIPSPRSSKVTSQAPPAPTSKVPSEAAPALSSKVPSEAAPALSSKVPSEAAKADSKSSRARSEAPAFTEASRVPQQTEMATVFSSSKAAVTELPSSESEGNLNKEQIETEEEGAIRAPTRPEQNQSGKHLDPPSAKSGPSVRKAPDASLNESPKSLPTPSPASGKSAKIPDESPVSSPASVSPKGKTEKASLVAQELDQVEHLLHPATKKADAAKGAEKASLVDKELASAAAMIPGLLSESPKQQDFGKEKDLHFFPIDYEYPLSVSANKKSALLSSPAKSPVRCLSARSRQLFDHIDSRARSPFAEPRVSPYLGQDSGHRFMSVLERSLVKHYDETIAIDVFLSHIAPPPSIQMKQAHYEESHYQGPHVTGDHLLGPAKYMEGEMKSARDDISQASSRKSETKSVEVLQSRSKSKSEDLSRNPSRDASRNASKEVSRNPSRDPSRSPSPRMAYQGGPLSPETRQSVINRTRKKYAIKTTKPKTKVQQKTYYSETNWAANAFAKLSEEKYYEVNRHWTQKEPTELQPDDDQPAEKSSRHPSKESVKNSRQPSKEKIGAPVHDRTAGRKVASRGGCRGPRKERKDGEEHPDASVISPVEVGENPAQNVEQQVNGDLEQQDSIELFVNGQPPKNESPGYGRGETVDSVLQNSKPTDPVLEGTHESPGDEEHSDARGQNKAKDEKAKKKMGRKSTGDENEGEKQKENKRIHSLTVGSLNMIDRQGSKGKEIVFGKHQAADLDVMFNPESGNTPHKPKKRIPIREIVSEDFTGEVVESALECFIDKSRQSLRSPPLSFVDVNKESSLQSFPEPAVLDIAPLAASSSQSKQERPVMELPKAVVEKKPSTKAVREASKDAERKPSKETERKVSKEAEREPSKEAERKPPKDVERKQSKKAEPASQKVETVEEAKPVEEVLNPVEEKQPIEETTEDLKPVEPDQHVEVPKEEEKVPETIVEPEIPEPVGPVQGAITRTDYDETAALIGTNDAIEWDENRQQTQTQLDNLAIAAAVADEVQALRDMHESMGILEAPFLKEEDPSRPDPRGSVCSKHDPAEYLRAPSQEVQDLPTLIDEAEKRKTSLSHPSASKVRRDSQLERYDRYASEDEVERSHDFHASTKVIVSKDGDQRGGLYAGKGHELGRSGTNSEQTPNLPPSQRMDGVAASQIAITKRATENAEEITAKVMKKKEGEENDKEEKTESEDDPTGYDSDGYVITPRYIQKVEEHYQSDSSISMMSIYYCIDRLNEQNEMINQAIEEEMKQAEAKARKARIWKAIRERERKIGIFRRTSKPFIEGTAEEVQTRVLQVFGVKGDFLTRVREFAKDAKKVENPHAMPDFKGPDVEDPAGHETSKQSESSDERNDKIEEEIEKIKAKRDKLKFVLTTVSDEAQTEDIVRTIDDVDDLLEDLRQQGEERKLRKQAQAIRKQKRTEIEELRAAQQATAERLSGIKSPPKGSANDGSPQHVSILAKQRDAIAKARAKVKMEKAANNSVHARKKRLLEEWDHLVHDNPWDSSPADCGPRNFDYAHQTIEDAAEASRKAPSYEPEAPHLSLKEHLLADPNAPLPWSKQAKRQQFLAQQKKEIITSIGKDIAQAVGDASKKTPGNLTRFILAGMNDAMYRAPEHHPPRKTRKPKNRETIVGNRQCLANRQSPELAQGTIGSTMPAAKGAPKGGLKTVTAKKGGFRTRPRTAPSKRGRSAPRPSRKMDRASEKELENMLFALEGVANATSSIQDYYIQSGQHEKAIAAVEHFAFADIDMGLQGVADGMIKGDKKGSADRSLSASRRSSKGVGNATMTTDRKSISNPRGSIAGGSNPPFRAGAPEPGIPDVLAPEPYITERVRSRIIARASLVERPPQLNYSASRSLTPSAGNVRSSGSPATSPDSHEERMKKHLQAGETGPITGDGIMQRAVDGVDVARGEGSSKEKGACASENAVQSRGPDSKPLAVLNATSSIRRVEVLAPEDPNVDPGMQLENPHTHRDVSLEQPINGGMPLTKFDLMELPKLEPGCGSALGALARHHGVKYNQALEPQANGLERLKKEKKEDTESKADREAWYAHRLGVLQETVGADMLNCTMEIENSSVKCTRYAGSHIKAASPPKSIVVPYYAPKERKKSMGRMIEKEFLSRVGGSGKNAAQMLRDNPASFQ